MKLKLNHSNSQQEREVTLPQRQILIWLEHDKSKADWLIMDSQGRSEFTRQAVLSTLQPLETDEIQIIIPSSEVLFTQAQLPRLKAYRLQQALPFALEEQVLDEVNNLHFVAGPYPAQQTSTDDTPQPLPVAVVKKQLMNTWLAHLQEAGIQPDAILPDIFLLPYVENQWQLHLSKNQASLRTGLYSGFSINVQSLATLLALKLEEAPQKPEKLVIFQDKNASYDLKSLGLPLEVQKISAEQWLNQGAANLHQYPFLNLLQTPYLSARKMKIPEKNKKAWRLAAYALALWLGIIFLGKFGSWAILSYEHQHLQNLITKTHQTHFPGTPAPLDPRTKMEAKLKKTLTQSEKGLLFQWLGHLTKASSAVRIQSLHFQNNQLSLDLTASSFNSLDNFILSLKEKGLEVKQQNASLVGHQVKAVITIIGKHS